MKIYWHWLLPLALIHSQNAWSEIVTDGSLNGTVQSVPAPQHQYNITPDLGKTVGNNLFHSFSQFNINQGETANFQAPSSTENIFTRVTGGSASHIDGTLNSSSSANLWLINPAGWIVGKDAALNVFGALHFTTANAIGFKDGGLFLADPVSKSTLTVAEPIDYQFTQAKQGTITIDATDIVLQPKKDFSLVGGDIKLQDSHVQAPGGRIMLGSNAGTGRWLEDAAGLKQQPGGGRGDISVTQSKRDTLTNPTFIVNELPDPEKEAQIGGGNIQIIGQQISMQNAMLSGLALDDQKGGSINLDGHSMNLSTTTLSTRTIGSQDAGPLSIKGGDLTLTGTSQTGSIITADTAVGSTGQSGTIEIDLTGALKMDHLSSISSKLLGSGNGGIISSPENAGKDKSSIFISSNDIALDQKSSITVATSNRGNAGNIKLQSDQLSLDRNSSISSAADRKEGNAGHITIASNDVRLQNFSDITSKSTSLSSGTAGNVKLSGRDTSAYGTLMLRQSKIGTSLLGTKGDGGNITVDTGVLVLNGGFIQANSSAKGGNGGTVAVTAKKSVYSRDQLSVGDVKRHIFEEEPNINVIQAAAPDGNSGTVTVSPVGLYISGQLAKVDAIFVNNRPIANDPCSVSRGAETSSLIQLGNGGLPPNASDAISLPVQRYLQNSSQALQTSAAEPTLQIALYTPSHLCSQDNS